MSTELHAKVNGEVFTSIPHDLYIPPDALEVFLDAFEGPLDLLLYLIQKENVDILNIPIASITEQYVRYVSLMKQFKLELAAEYLVMAAWLAEIKSRLLLPLPPSQNQEEVDPRAELIRRLQEYEQIKVAAENLTVHPQAGRDFFEVNAFFEILATQELKPEFSLEGLSLALQKMLSGLDLKMAHLISREPLSVRERMASILGRLEKEEHCSFYSLFSMNEGRRGIVVSFMAVLELLKDNLIAIVQSDVFVEFTISKIAIQQAVPIAEGVYA
jgi:segregation and condensation protein A